MFTDPFGLKADTIIVDRSIQSEVNNCRSTSRTCDNYYRWADELPQRIDIRAGKVSGNHLGGETVPKSGLFGISSGSDITVDASTFDQASQQLNLPVSAVEIIAHELGHAILNALGKNTGDTEPLVIPVENAARRDLQQFLMRKP